MLNDSPYSLGVSSVSGAPSVPNGLAEEEHPVTVLAMAITPVFAQSTTGTLDTKAEHAAPSAADQTFVKKAAVGGMAEVELGILGKDKAVKPIASALR
jgi:hypothetical protein